MVFAMRERNKDGRAQVDTHRRRQDGPAMTRRAMQAPAKEC